MHFSPDKIKFYRELSYTFVKAEFAFNTQVQINTGLPTILCRLKAIFLSYKLTTTDIVLALIKRFQGLKEPLMICNGNYMIFIQLAT